MTDVSPPLNVRAEVTDVSPPWYTRARIIEWDADFMRWSMSRMVPCIEKSHPGGVVLIMVGRKPITAGGEHITTGGKPNPAEGFSIRTLNKITCSFHFMDPKQIFLRAYLYVEHRKGKCWCKKYYIRCRYYVWYHASSLLFCGSLTRIQLRFRSSEVHQTQTCGRKFATQNTLIPTFRTFHRPKYVGLKLPNVSRFQFSVLTSVGHFGYQLAISQSSINSPPPFTRHVHQHILGCIDI